MKRSEVRLRIPEGLHEELTRAASEATDQLKRPVSMNEVVVTLLMTHDGVVREDFHAGARRLNKVA